MLREISFFGLCAIASLSSASWPFNTSPGATDPEGSTLSQTLAQSSLRFTPSSQNPLRWSAPQRTFGYRAELSEAGMLELSTTKLGSQIRVRLASIGRGESRAFQSDPHYAGLDVDVRGWPLLEYRRETVDEWYVNEPDGLHHWFEVKQRPTSFAPGPLVLDLQVVSDAEPYTISASAIGFEGSNLIYSGLRAWDARGNLLDTRMEATQHGIAIMVADGGALYPITIDPAWTQMAKLTGTPTPTGLGGSSAIDDDTAVFGATTTNDAFVFTRSDADGSWSQQARLLGSDSVVGNNFGISVSVSGDTAIVGAPDHNIGGKANAGAAYVFTRSGSSWTQQAKISLPLESQYVQFGTAVAIDGDTALITAFYGTTGPDDDGGAAFVFTRSGSTWSQQAKLSGIGAGPNDEVGKSVAIDGNLAVVGAHLGGMTDTGAAYVFRRSGSSWSQEAQLAGGGAANDQFGTSVDVNGNSVIVGEPNRDNGADANVGAAYLFEFSGTWGLTATLTPASRVAGDRFGASVSVNGTRAFIGAPGRDNGAADVGAVYRFVDSGSWAEDGVHYAADMDVSDAYGTSVALDGDSVAVGASVADAGNGAGYVISLLPAISGITTDISLVGGDSGNGTVTMETAQDFPTVVTLESSEEDALQVPESVIIPTGETSADFEFTTTEVESTTMVTITATAGGGEETSNVTVLSGPPSLVGLTAATTSFPWYTTTTGTVTLDDPAPVGGTEVTLFVSSTRGSVPASVTVLEGQTTANFSIGTTLNDPSQAWNFRVFAQLDETRLDTTMVILPAQIKSMGFHYNPTRFNRGSSIVIYTRWVAPAGGWEISLTCTDPVTVPVPATVTVPEGLAYVVVPLSVGAGPNPGFVDIQATLGTHSVTERLFINP